MVKRPGLHRRVLIRATTGEMVINVYVSIHELQA